MVRRNRSVTISSKFLGISILVALIIDVVLPKAGIGGFSSIATLIYLVVALYLMFLG